MSEMTKGYERNLFQTKNDFRVLPGWWKYYWHLHMALHSNDEIRKFTHFLCRKWKISKSSSLKLKLKMKRKCYVNKTERNPHMKWNMKRMYRTEKLRTAATPGYSNESKWKINLQTVNWNDLLCTKGRF